MKSGQISTLITEGRAYKSSSFLFKVMKSDSFDASTRNVAFLAPKKQFKTAVLRNKARRRARSALCAVCFDIYSTSTPLKFKEYYILFNLYLNILTVDFKELKNEVRQVLDKSGILNTL